MFRPISTRSLCRLGLPALRHGADTSCAALIGSSATTNTHHHHHHHNNNTSRRLFHATPRREFLPLLVPVTVFVLGRYSWKALQRMDDEWEDYQWELQQYERMQQQQHGDENTTQVRTVAIDLGTVQTKLAVSHPQPQLVTTREGDRSFFNGIVYLDKDTTNDPDATDEIPESVLRGNHALERFYYNPLLDDNHASNTDSCPVTLPWNQLETNQAHRVVDDALGPALNETLNRLGFHDNTDESVPFRSVVTVPSSHLSSNVYPTVFGEFLPTFLPEPVAAIWGAQTSSWLPTEHTDDDSKTTTTTTTTANRQGSTTLVVDVGGQTLQVSLVQKDIVLASVALPWGGERWIQLLVRHLLLLLNNNNNPLQDARSLAALQVQARTAVAELSTTSRVDIHVPYLFADPNHHHLDATLSRTVLEQIVQDDIRDTLVPNAEKSNNSAFSPHMPRPTDLSSVLVSTLTQVLEWSEKTPVQLDHVLLVGGAARAPLVQQSLQQALALLVGPSSSLAQLVIPERAVLPDLVALGACTLLPSFDYSVERGLERHAA